MRKSIIHSTENSNFYLYDAQHLFSMLIHPELRKAHEKSTDVDPYYLKKYKYLKERGFFGKSKSVDFEITLDESVVKENIIQARQIVFETTDHCNLSCSYCSLGELYNFGKKDRKNVNTRYAINFLKYIFELKPPKTKLMIGFFGGEPLLNINFIKKIVEVTKELNIEKKLNIEFNMTTNATLIHKHIQFLVDNNFTLLVSLDGDEEGHSYRTFAKNNENSFPKVIENIDMIQKNYPEYFVEKVDFNAVLNNKNSVKDIYGFIYNRYHKIPTIAPMNRGDIDPDKKDLFKKMFHDRRESEKEYQKEDPGMSPVLRRELMSYRDSSSFLNNYSINFYISNLLYLLYDKVNSFPTGTCFPFDRKLFLNTHHNILPCEKVSHKHSMGKVNNKVSIDIPEIVRKYDFYYDHFKKICQNCYSTNACKICLLSLENLDKLGTKEFVCPSFQDHRAFKNKLNRIFSFLEKYPDDFFQIIDKMMIE